MANPVISEILRQGRGKPRRYVLAALETGRVESNFRNLPGGDADSQGWRQERKQYYSNPRNISASVRRFYQEAAAHDRGQSAGHLAADVQRPAAQYRSRYGQHAAEARRLYRGGGGGGGGGGGATTYGYRDPKRLKFNANTGVTAAATKFLESQRQAHGIVASSPIAAPAFAARAPMPKDYQPTVESASSAPVKQGTDLKTAVAKLASASASYKAGTRGGGRHSVTVGGGGGGGGGGKVGKLPKGVASYKGVQVAAWIAPALRYAAAHGWKGSVSSGYRSYAKQKAIYDSGVRPAAKPGTSNHEGTTFPRGAVDVSQAAQLSQILRRSKYRNLLQWAGAKDPVHFSHPHGGGY